MAAHKVVIRNQANRWAGLFLAGFGWLVLVTDPLLLTPAGREGWDGSVDQGNLFAVLVALAISSVGVRVFWQPRIEVVGERIHIINPLREYRLSRSDVLAIEVADVWYPRLVTEAMRIPLVGAEHSLRMQMLATGHPLTRQLDEVPTEALQGDVPPTPVQVSWRLPGPVEQVLVGVWLLAVGIVLLKWGLGTDQLIGGV